MSFDSQYIEELENDELNAGPSSGADALPPGDELPPGHEGDLPPSEPPVDDAAIGADTEGNVVLALLKSIKDLLAKLVGEEAGVEGDLEGEAGAAPPPPGDEGDEAELDAVPEVPDDDDGYEPDDDPAEGGEEEEDEFKPRRGRRELAANED